MVCDVSGIDGFQGRVAGGPAVVLLPAQTRARSLPVGAAFARVRHRRWAAGSPQAGSRVSRRDLLQAPPDPVLSSAAATSVDEGDQPAVRAGANPLRHRPQHQVGQLARDLAVPRGLQPARTPFPRAAGWAGVGA